MRRRTVTVITFPADGRQGNRLKLDTAKYHNIGFTDESLHEFMRLIVNEGDRYTFNDDKIDGKRVKRDLNNQVIAA
jgi:hypothetical protein